MTDDYTSQSHKLEENPGDYEQHLKVLTIAEKLNDAAKIRKSYESLLSEFPLLHSYWKKFADFELNQGDYVKARQVCERGLSSKAALHSVDLWTYYCGMMSDRSNDTNEIRSMFERASNNVGDDFAAHQLWDKFLEFEMVREDYLRVRQLFDRILAIPLEKTSSYFDKFKKFLNERKVADLLTNDELKQLEAEQGSGEAQQKMKVLAARDDVFKKTLEQVKKREPFEIIIAKRAGFSMTPVTDEVLTAWREYLEAEEKCAESNVRKLYERCVLSCGNSPEFWRRYIYYLEKTDEQLIEDVFQRAAVILKRRPELQLEHALYAESRGQLDRAEQIYQTLLKNIPGHIESSLRYIHFKRRTVPAECAAMYAKLLTDTSAPTARTLVSIEYARFLEHVTGDIEQARAVFANESSRSSSVLELWLSWLHFELRHRTGTDRETAVAQLCTQALQGDSLGKSDRVELLRAWLDVVECCGTDLTRERQISRDLLLLSADQKTSTVSKKRSADHAELEQSPRPNKQSKQDDSSNYAANQAYDQYYQNYASYPGYANYYQGNYVNYQ